jgi:hypothetical protein
VEDRIGNAKKDSVIIPRLQVQVSLYSRESALPEEGSASEDGGWPGHRSKDLRLNTSAEMD